MGGPSDQAKANEAAQTAFYDTMTQEQKAVFGESQGIFNMINGATSAILAKGPNQYGFTPEEDSLLRGQITAQGATATANAVNATELAARQSRGGAPAPTGSDAAIQAEAEVVGGQKTAQALSEEKLAGYQAGRDLYSQALGALTGEQSLLNPVGTAGAATGAGQGATSAINLADSERSTLLQSLLGGLVQGGIGAATGGLGTAVSKIGSGDFGW